MRIKLLLYLAFAILLFGCGKSDQTIAKKTGNKVGETVTDFFSGVGTGIDKKMKVPVELSKELENMGITKTMAKENFNKPENFNNPENSISVYILSKNKAKLLLIAKAINKDNLEIGRALTPVEFGTDDAKYVKFIFPKELDMRLVEKYNIETKNNP